MTLSGTETGPKNDAETASVWGFSTGSCLENFGPTEEDSVLVVYIDVESLIGFEELDRLLEQGC